MFQGLHPCGAVWKHKLEDLNMQEKLLGLDDQPIRVTELV